MEATSEAAARSTELVSALYKVKLDSKDGPGLAVA